MSDEQLGVKECSMSCFVESVGGDSMIVYHGCRDARAAHSIGEHGFMRSSPRDGGYFGRGIYATPNAEYACRYAIRTADVGDVVMCRACGSICLLGHPR